MFAIILEGVSYDLAEGQQSLISTEYIHPSSILRSSFLCLHGKRFSSDTVIGQPCITYLQTVESTESVDVHDLMSLSMSLKYNLRFGYNKILSNLLLCQRNVEFLSPSSSL